MVKKVKNIVALIMIAITILFTNMTMSQAISPSNQTIYQGIDVSNWQGNIDFSKVKAAGIEIVYIKASEGTTYRDPYFETNYTNAKANGLKVGFYHFLTATNEEQARNQARFFASVISGKSPDCKLVMDFEQFRNGISVIQINEISKIFLETVKQLTGKDVIVYSNLYDSQRIFDSSLAGNYELWLAYWGDESNLSNLTSNWSQWIGWQYTSRGIVSGINGYVDRNKFTSNIFLSECTNCPSVEAPNVEEPQTDGNLTCEMGHIVYTVKSGDTLWNISRTYGTTVSTIAELNSIRNPNLIYPGQKFRIPCSSSFSNMNQVKTYIVRSGDTLWGISRRYGVTVNYLVNKNGIRNPNLIFPGQIINL